MGEQADLIINGDVCQVCGENFDDEGPGYPRSCSSCGGGTRKKNKEDNVAKAFRAFKEAGFEWQTFNNGLQWRVAGVDFYPTTHKWFDPRQECRGSGIDMYIKYIKTRQHKIGPEKKILTVEQIFEAAKKSKKTNLFEICEAIHKEIYGQERPSK